MPEITPQQLEEYQMLQRYHRKQLELESIQGLTLEQDIDAPIKKCVMAFALLGCSPLWSCCGFDYYGQPIHKWHQYGRTFFILEEAKESIDTLADYARFKGSWSARRVYETKIDLSVDFFSLIPEWRYEKCPYYSESAVQHIGSLERFLLDRKDKMLSEVILRDSSKIYKDRFAYWQYPPREDWLIRKEDLYA